METPQKTSKRNVMLNYGLLLGFIMILLSVGNYSLGDIYEPHWSLNVLSIVILIVVIVLGIKKLKAVNEGALSLGQALKTGVGIALVSVLLFMVYFYVFAKFIEPEFIERTAQVNMEKALERSPDMPQESLDMQVSMTKKYFFAFAFGFIAIVNLFIGFITSLIAGLAMKSEQA